MADAIAGTIANFQLKFGLPDCQVIVNQGIPEHVGLGSKTAYLMALARALSRHFSLGLDYMDLAALVGRGGTSGIGIHTSQFGGIVIDAGHHYPDEKSSFVPSSASRALPPPLKERHAAPDECVVIHLRLDTQGLSGKAEKDFFQRHCPIPEQETQRLLSMVDEILLPGIRRGSLPELNEGLQALQGMGMKAREWTIQGPMTQGLRAKWEDARTRQRGISLPPMCLSSMGPTVFMLSDNPESVIAKLGQLGIDRTQISVGRPNISGNVVVSE